MAKPPSRRTQAERRLRTRTKLQDATIHLLAHDGYSGTTIAAVAEAAGVSRGATLHHFPQKLDLVCEVLADRIRTAVDELPDRVGGVLGDWTLALDLVYEAFQSELAQALFAAQLRARVDPELRERIEPAWESVLARIDQLAEPLFGAEIAALPDRAPLIRFVITTIRGLVMLGGLNGEDDNPRWTYERNQILELLESRLLRVKDQSR